MRFLAYTYYETLIVTKRIFFGKPRVKEVCFCTFRILLRAALEVAGFHSYKKLRFRLFLVSGLLDVPILKKFCIIAEHFSLGQDKIISITY